ncbi:MAG: hypothetical protein C0478_17300 [Planctomyces sp.]|nr:hypothetical protein [Planctomyces sp.]
MPLKHLLMATICLIWCAEACPAREPDYFSTYKQIISGKEIVFTNVCFMDNKQWIAAKKMDSRHFLQSRRKLTEQSSWIIK